MIFKEYNQTDIINIKNQIDRLRACGIGVADLPQNLRDSVWKIVYCELKQNGSRQNTVSKAADGVCQSNILEKMFGLPKDVFGKKYWNMYSPDSKIRQEKYSDLQLPFNYAQVECNSVYRAMIHHMITGADVPTDTVVDIFGKFGLAAALCAGGYKYKIVCLNEQNFYLYSLLQDVMRKPVKFYKMIDEERKYLEIKLADNEIKDIMKSQIQHLGQIKVLVYYGVRKNVGGQYSYESTGYTKEQIAKYIFICLCFAPEYWVETNLEVKNNKMVTGWLDDEKTYKKCVTNFVKLSQEDFVAFAKKFSELKFVNCDISRVIDIIRKNADNQNYSSGDIQKFLLYIDVPKYIKEYQRFGFDGTMMISLLKMLHHYEGNWIMTWSTFLQKGLNDENPTLYDMLYTQQEMQSDIYIAHGNYERFEEKVPVKVIYNMFDMIDKDKNLFVFIYRDKNKNKQQNIVFVTDIDFDEIDCESFFRKYKMKFNGKEKLLKLKWREFKKNYVKFS